MTDMLSLRYLFFSFFSIAISSILSFSSNLFLFDGYFIYFLLLFYYYYYSSRIMCVYYVLARDTIPKWLPKADVDWMMKNCKTQTDNGRRRCKKKTLLRVAATAMFRRRLQAPNRMDGVSHRILSLQCYWRFFAIYSGE